MILSQVCLNDPQPSMPRTSAFCHAGRLLPICSQACGSNAAKRARIHNIKFSLIYFELDMLCLSKDGSQAVPRLLSKRL